nr:hypothetical protein [Tanacetum cinerariifolium]
MEAIEGQAENKRRRNDNSRNNNAQPQPYKKQNVTRAYSARTGEKGKYTRTLPLCNKCNHHHNRPCAAKCMNCKRYGYLASDCRRPAANNQNATRTIQKIVTCFECRKQGHYKMDCLKLKSQGHGNAIGHSEARGKAYVLG